MAAAWPHQLEPSTSSSGHTYQVFLSFRGGDTRKGFTDHLYSALKWQGIHTFRDDDEISRGEDIDSEIQTAIKESKMSVIVFSKDYASSPWCLDELVLIMKRRESVGHIVLPVFYRVDPSDVSEQRGCFADSFVGYEEKYGNRMEKVDGWRDALRKVSSLAGMVLTDDGYESRFIQDIVREVGHKLNRNSLNIPLCLIRTHDIVEDIASWLEYGQNDVGMGLIYGIGGVGKTTVAKTVFNINRERFDSWSFLNNVRERAAQPKGMVQLQRQLLSDILKEKERKIYNEDEGINLIQNALSHKRVLIVLDDVDDLEHFKKIIGLRELLCPGSKIIITTRNKGLLRSYKACRKFLVESLSDDDSLTLFSWHAFGQFDPIEGYEDLSKRIVHHCGGLPLALEVLGSSLRGRSMKLWERALLEPEAIGDGKIQKILRISFDSLQDDRDKNLFLDIVCFFLGKNLKDLDSVVVGSELYRKFGIQKLIERCLLTIDEENKLTVHQMLIDMGREIVRQESTEDPEKRSRIWRDKDAHFILKRDNGTETIRSLILDQQVNLNLTREMNYESQAFAKMSNLKLLHLNNVKVKGGFNNFSTKLVWLCWRRFPLDCIPNNLKLEDVVVLDMRNSNLKHVWKDNRILMQLRILKLSHCHNLAKTPDFKALPGLEQLIVKDCMKLVEIHESIGMLERITHIDLRDCTSLVKLPNSIVNIKTLESLILSGCKKLDELPFGLEKMESLEKLYMDNTAAIQPHSTTRTYESGFWSWFARQKRQRISTFSLSALPSSLTELCLSYCNLSDNAFLKDLTCLPSLTYLNLGGNPLQSLPKSIKSLTKLDTLVLNGCDNLHSLPELPRSVLELGVEECYSLQRITNLPNLFKRLNLDIFECCQLLELEGLFKLEPITDADIEMARNIELYHLELIEGVGIIMFNHMSYTAQITGVQVLRECGIFNIFIPGSDIPSWYEYMFEYHPESYSFTFDVPEHDHDNKIIGVNLCVVLAQSISNPIAHAQITNETTGLKYSYIPTFFGINPEDNGDTLWLSCWKFGNDQLRSGDRLNVYVGSLISRMELKRFGVHLVYEMEEDTHQTEGNISVYKQTLSNIDLSAYLKAGTYHILSHCYYSSWFFHVLWSQQEIEAVKEHEQWLIFHAFLRWSDWGWKTSRSFLLTCSYERMHLLFQTVESWIEYLNTAVKLLKYLVSTTQQSSPAGLHLTMMPRQLSLNHEWSRRERSRHGSVMTWPGIAYFAFSEIQTSPFYLVYSIDILSKIIKKK